MIKILLEDTKEATLRNCEESFVFFKQVLLKHCVQRPPWSMGIFTKKDVDRIVTFVIRRCVVLRYFSPASGAVLLCGSCVALLHLELLVSRVTARGARACTKN